MKGFIEGFFMAWGNFSIIPCPYKVWTDRGKKWMLALMPLMGFVIGGINYGIGYLSMEILPSIPLFFMAAVLALLPNILTGFIHLDGFMDCCDAILSRRDLETRQRILKDSTVGAFSVICVCIAFLLAVTASADILINGGFYEGFLVMMFVQFFSRNFAAGDVLRLKPMETSQYAYKNEEIRQKDVSVLNYLLFVLVFVLGAGISYFLGIVDKFIISTVTVIVVQKIFRYRAVKSLGGINGDIAGYTIVLSEIAGLISLSFLL